MMAHNFRQLALAFLCLSIAIGATTQAQHSYEPYPVSSFNLSPDGTRVALVGRIIDNPNFPEGLAFPIDIVDLQTGELLQTINDVAGFPNAISWSPDGSRLVYSGDLGHVVVLDVISGTAVDFIWGMGFESGGATWNPVDNRIAAYTGGEVIIANGITGELIGTQSDEHARGMITAIAWSVDGTRLASTTFEDGVGRIAIWDMVAANSINQLVISFDGVGAALAWNPDGTRLAASGRGRVDLYNTTTGQKLSMLSTDRDSGVFDISWSPDGDRIAGGGQSVIWVWDVVSNQIIDTIETSGNVASLEWTPNGEQLIHNGGPEGVYIDGIPLAETLNSGIIAVTPLATSAPAVNEGSETFQSETEIEQIYGQFALSPDGTHAAITQITFTPQEVLEDSIFVIDIQTSRVLDVFAGLGIYPNAVSWSPDGTRLVMSGSRGQVHVLDTTNDQVIDTELGGFGVDIGGATWNPVDDRIAVFLGRSVAIGEVTVRENIQTLIDVDDPSRITAIAWSPDGTRLASTTFDRHIQIWDMTQAVHLGRLITKFDGGGSVSLAWHPDRRLLASNTRGGVEVYDTLLGRSLGILSTGNDAIVYEVQWSPDGSLLAGAGAETIWVWDSATRAIVKTLQVPDGITSIAWTIDSSQLIYSGPEGLYIDGIPLGEAPVTATPFSAGRG